MSEEQKDREIVARCIAARKMGMIKDKRGERLPSMFWRRYQEMAAALLIGNTAEEACQLAELLVGPV